MLAVVGCDVCRSQTLWHLMFVCALLLLLQCNSLLARDCCGKGLNAGQQCGCTPGVGSSAGFQRLCLYSIVSTSPTVVQTGSVCVGIGGAVACWRKGSWTADAHGVCVEFIFTQPTGADVHSVLLPLDLPHPAHCRFLHLHKVPVPCLKQLPTALACAFRKTDMYPLPGCWCLLLAGSWSHSGIKLLRPPSGVCHKWRGL